LVIVPLGEVEVFPLHLDVEVDHVSLGEGQQVVLDYVNSDLIIHRIDLSFDELRYRSLPPVGVGVRVQTQTGQPFEWFQGEEIVPSPEVGLQHSLGSNHLMVLLTLKAGACSRIPSRSIRRAVRLLR
jgi:hypothetical protein